MGGVFGSAVNAVREIQTRDAAVLGAAVGGVFYLITTFVKV